jgi:hypothetical protein
MSEKRDRRTPTRHARRKARARSTRVSTHFLDADTLFANDTPFGVSAADPSRAPIATGVAPTPRAYASDRTDTVKKVDGAEEVEDDCRINLLTAARAPGGRGSPAQLGRGRIFKIEKKRA